jgi:hypothetical protein
MLGPVADTGTIDEAVRRMSPVPIGRIALAAVLVPAALPMIVVAALRILVKDIML